MTITAGTDYTAPASLAKAFIRVMSSHHTGTRIETGDSNVQQQAGTCWINNPGNLLTSITFQRYGAATDTLTINWEIVEYVGAGGGANEFVVRGQGIDSLTTAEDASTTGTISGISTVADCVAWITGQGAANLSTIGREAMHIASINDLGAGDVTITLTRERQNAEASTVSYALIEFVGSAWTVQRATHTTTTPGTEETETVSTVGDIANAFVHHQFKVGGELCDDDGCRAWLSAATTVSFQTDSGASAVDSVAWVMQNASLVVTRFTGTDATNASWNHDVTSAGLADLAKTTLEEVGVTVNQATSSFAAEIVAARLTSTTNVELRRSRVLATSTYRFATVVWP